MKMEMLVKAECDGVVKSTLVNDGGKVTADDLMVELA
jgi:biotin carboxyl carrier protein